MYGRRDAHARSIVVAFAAVCALTLASAAIASAGEYHVYSCRTPDGQVAPVDGWSSSTTGVSDYVEDGCAEGKGLLAALEDGGSHSATTDTATWNFVVPKETELAAATIWRAGDADGGLATNATYEFWLAGSEDSKVFDECVYEFGCQLGLGSQVQPMSSSNRIVVADPNLGTNLYLNASCGGIPTYKCPSGKGDVNGYAAAIYLYAADLVLEQTSQPTFSNVEGELATSPTLSGTADLSFHAEDPGSGVYEAVFTVDGVEAGRTVLDENGGRCKRVGQATDGLPDFLYLQPCKSSLTADVPFDTTELADGTHHLVVSVTDAAGNSTVVLDRRITVSNHPQVSSSPLGSSTEQGATELSPTTPPLVLTAPMSPPQNDPVASQQSIINGQNASTRATLTVHWSTVVKAALAGAYGHAHTVAGRLTAPDGSPVVGALVQAFYTPLYQGAHALALASVHTRADGSFIVRLRASIPSSRLSFVYNSNPGQARSNVTASLSLAVTSGLRLSVNPHVSHVGGTIVFKGMLHGSPIPSGGKQLVLEARTPRSPWRQFDVIATSRRGAYHASYRFRLSGPIVYEFRAVSAHEADFPYATGASNVVRVREH